MTADVPHPSPGLSESTLERLAAAKHIAVLTGGGMSADSGLPTYRSGADALRSSVVANEGASARAWRCASSKFSRPSCGQGPNCRRTRRYRRRQASPPKMTPKCRFVAS